VQDAFWLPYPAKVPDGNAGPGSHLAAIHVLWLEMIFALCLEFAPPAEVTAATLVVVKMRNAMAPRFSRYGVTDNDHSCLIQNVSNQRGYYETNILAYCSSLHCPYKSTNVSYHLKRW
jgi:hypothetical protein